MQCPGASAILTILGFLSLISFIFPSWDLLFDHHHKALALRSRAQSYNRLADIRYTLFTFLARRSKPRNSWLRL
jgi:hypothetical protein